MSDECSTSSSLVDSSDFSTPELSPPASDSESSNHGALFSTLSSSDETPDVITDITVIIGSNTKSPIALGFPMDNQSSPEKFCAGKNGRPRTPPHRPAPLLLVGSPPPSPTYLPPQKLQKPIRDESSNFNDSTPSSYTFFPRPGGLLRWRSWSRYVPTKPSSLSRRSSLPSMPSASIFPMDQNNDIQTRANERTVKFESPFHEENARRSRRRRNRSPHPNRRAGTDALVSLVWSGEFPSVSANAKSSMGDTFFYSSVGFPPTSLKNGLKSRSFSGDQADDWDGVAADEDVPLVSPPIAAPLLSSQRRSDPPKFPCRCWTLVMVIADDKISDEELVDELERMRTMENVWQWQWGKNVATPSTATTISTADPEMPLVDVSHDERVTLKPPLSCLSDPVLSAVWQTTRQALLICREFVRTERHYLLAIRSLSSGDTLTKPPALMLAYLPALIEASEDLLERLEVNPSVPGVANAFLLCGDKLDAALVAWCGVVGGFFVSADEGVVKRERAISSTTPRVDENAANTTIKRRVNSWGKRINSIKALGNSAPSTLSQESHKLPQNNREQCWPSVRDLAILPTQRIMRYTLLFKDLYSHAPTGSSSRDGIEKAMNAAISLARKCDRAQGNAAFLHKPTKNT